MGHMTDTDARPTGPEQRAPGDRRKYNRRSSATELSPPYFEVFERIAVALEDIRDAVTGPRDVLLPADPPRGPAVPHPSPRET